MVRPACHGRPPRARTFRPFPFRETPSRMLATLGRRCEDPDMSAPLEIPQVVSRALDVARRRGYASFCRHETGRLLAALAASREGVVAEFGTGTGVGTAWLRSGARSGTRIVSAELDPDLAGAASEVFADDPQVEVV